MHRYTNTEPSLLQLDSFPTASSTHRARFPVLGWVVAVLALWVAPALAQLTPDRLYYGVDRAMPMSIERPNDAGDGELSVALFQWGVAEPVATASVAEGKVDLSALFPTLWQQRVPFPLHLAQLLVGDTQHGSPVVLQPMVTPRPATRVPNGNGRVQFSPSPNVYSGIRAYTEKLVVFDTDRGEIRFRMRPDQAPNTSWNFLTLVDGGFYTDIIFHRILNSGRFGRFVIQVGDPTGTGSGGPGYLVDLEPSQLAHDFGVLSMARSSDPDSNGSQVFVCLSRAGTAMLDGNYCAFAEAVSGAEIINYIAATPVGGAQRSSPLDPKPVLRRAYTVPAPTHDQRPERIEDPTLGNDDSNSQSSGTPGD